VHKTESTGRKARSIPLKQTGWKVSEFPASGEVFFSAFPSIELLGIWPLRTWSVCELVYWR